MRDRIVDFRRVRAGDLHPDPRNWRTHPPAQRKALQAMLGRLGMVDAVIARETPDGLTLVDGHLRASIDADAQIPVLIVDLTDDEAGEALATIDPLSAMATADKGMLRDLMDGLGNLPIDLDRLYGLPPALDQKADESEEPPTEPTTKRGDIWRCGRHRLMCGDSTDAADVERLLDGARPRLMVTDPPFGIEFDPADPEGVRIRRGSGGARTEYIESDNEAKWVAAWNLSPAALVYCYSSASRAVDTFNGLSQGGFIVHHMFIWRKTHPVMNRGFVGYQHEVLWFGARKNETLGFLDHLVSSVFDIAHDPIDPANHAAQKPVECMERPIRHHEGDVYEPFCGSGTTLIAAERQKRACWAMELDPGFVDATVRRWEIYTGGHAELERRSDA